MYSTLYGKMWSALYSKVHGAVRMMFMFVVQMLFVNNEQGVWYDPNDLSTLFQDSAGTIPVTAAGQPVGLMLDKRLGLVRGPELVGALDLTAWTSQGSVTGKTATGFTTSAAGGVSKDVGMVAGKWYSVRIVGTASSTLTCRNLNGFSLGGFTVAAGAFDTTAVIFWGGAGALYLTLSVAGTATITSLSSRELPGNHAFQAAAASRPTLRLNATTGAYYLEFDGVDDFLQTNSIDFTGTDKVSVFTGVRKLSDAATGILCELSASAGLNNGAFWLAAPGNAGQPNYSCLSRGSTNSTAVLPSAFSAPITNVLTALCSIAGDSVLVRANGTQAATATTDQGAGNYGNYPLYIGRRGGTSLPFNGHLYGLIITGRLCTSVEIGNVERMLAKRTGVTLS